MSITDKSPAQQRRRNWSSRFRAFKIDRRNQRRFGASAPRFAELLWIPTASLQYAVKLGSSKDSAEIIQHWPSDAVVPVTELPSIKACLSHWQDGVPWEETGIFQQMLKKIQEKGKVDRLRNLDDIRERYKSVDELYGKVSFHGGLSPRSEFVPGNFREEGGILVHIGPDGTPYFGKKGHHRLAIAIALKIEIIPVQLGFVHGAALDQLDKLRQQGRRLRGR